MNTLNLWQSIVVVRTIITIVLLKIGLKLLPFSLFKNAFSSACFCIPAFSKRREQNIKFKILAIQKVSHHVPFSFLCLGQALAFKFYLRKAKDYHLRIGVKISDSRKINAHAWIEHNSKIILGDLPDIGNFKTLWSWE